VCNRDANGHANRYRHANGYRNSRNAYAYAYAWTDWEI